MSLYFKRIKSNIKLSVRNMFQANMNGFSDYEAVIDALNALQSNANYIKNRKFANRHTKEGNTPGKMKSFVERSGIGIESLNKLPIIHITGTKGKGSTSAYCESILRHHGLHTGFYSSPHLIEVVERIKLDGKPISKNLFSRNFWSIYTNLQKTKGTTNIMPIYFEMLTLVAIKTFIEEKVDVAIIEVGIGGEFDSTNIFENKSVAGITPIGLDHIVVLGNTIEKIAWQKAGIMKKGCKTFTVPQTAEAMKVINERSIEKESPVEVVNNIADKYYKNPDVPQSIYNANASLAITLAKNWMDINANNIKFCEEKTREGLKDFNWSGRFQILRSESINYYLDGAHTKESITHCLNWFKDKTKQSLNKKVLIFNSTGEREVKIHMEILNKFKFDKVCFVPNIATSNIKTDCLYVNFPESEQLLKCQRHYDFWREVSPNFPHGNIFIFPTIKQGLIYLQDENNYDVLVTGSLHLIGSVLSIINPSLDGVTCTNLNAENLEMHRTI